MKGGLELPAARSGDSLQLFLYRFNKGSDLSSSHGIYNMTAIRGRSFQVCGALMDCSLLFSVSTEILNVKENI